MQCEWYITGILCEKCADVTCEFLILPDFDYAQCTPFTVILSLCKFKLCVCVGSIVCSTWNLMEFIAILSLCKLGLFVCLHHRNESLSMRRD